MLSILTDYVFRKWIDENIKTATERTIALQTIRNDVKKLEESIVNKLKLKGIQYDCDWNIEHVRGCLKSLDHLSKMHEADMKELEGLLKSISLIY